MKKISFECEDESVELYVNIILKLQGVRGDRKIRIGGSEYDFYEDVDGAVSRLCINDVEWHSLSSTEHREFAVMRSDMISGRNKTSVVVDNSPVDTVPTSVVNGDDEVACVGCGKYVSASKMDSEGLCPNCSDEEVTQCNLSDWATQKIKDELNESLRMMRIFTAFDITKRVRKNKVRCKHDDVKQIVHNAYINGEMPNYDRSLIDVGTAIQPWLYCPVSRIVDDYNHGDN